MTGEQPSTENLLTVARRFEDELTLDNLSRPQLVSMCKYMNINAFGTDNFLRFQIRNRMRQIKADDIVCNTHEIIKKKQQKFFIFISRYSYVYILYVGYSK